MLKSKFIGVASLFVLLSTSAFAYGGHAAIVFNPATGAVGSSHGATTRADSEVAALGYLPAASLAGVTVDYNGAEALEAGQTSLKETFVENGWVALARGNGRWATAGVINGVSYHDSQADAEYAACTSCGGSANSCYIVRSLASYLNFDDVSGADVSNTSLARVNCQ